ncbi:Sodium channel protein type 2 subunit alpha (HBSC II) (Sodium channel protein brain II subunit alpha) (Sodium channel protein type II subunit alpha) (Voltage-gated sodium channel subunit alpha Nav1.2) [Durusdinium trenchii]|uniref:Sodium channel protein type 2 subunit alpha (HBSC II) (Sodium channel protein brain II subunit alpha) (Sodium channel protein type II subunit alpha) (Voltage-gated sodium channel subunit alpha Nav1.2) n=1 Tax=Durusdinium trenchii TaxID=1381693 RepID=A0ABP0HGE5_9DINO
MDREETGDAPGLHSEHHLLGLCSLEGPPHASGPSGRRKVRKIHRKRVKAEGNEPTPEPEAGRGDCREAMSFNTLCKEMAKCLAELQDAHRQELREVTQAELRPPCTSTMVGEFEAQSQSHVAIEVLESENEKEASTDWPPKATGEPTGMKKQHSHSHIGCPNRQQFGLSVEKLHALGNSAIDEIKKDEQNPNRYSRLKKMNPTKQIKTELRTQLSNISDIFVESHVEEKQEQKKRQEEKKKRLLKDTNSYRAPKTQDPAKTDDEDPPTWRHQLADFVDWWPFQVWCMFVIVANALHIFIQADAKMVNAYKTALEGGTPMEDVHYVDVLFALWFVVELAMRILPDGLFYFFWESEDQHWNIFDTVVTAEAVVGLLLRLTFPWASGARILGVFRIFRLVKHMDWHKGLRKLRKTLMALVGSLMDLIWAFLVVVLCLVTYSVFLSTATVGYFESFGHTRLVLLTSRPDERSELSRVLDEFGTVPTTMLSLWSAISGGNDWMGYAETLRIMDKQDIFFGTFVVFTAFCVIGLFNVVTGVFVDSAVEASKSFRSNVEVIEEHKDQEKQEKMEEANLLKLLSTSAGKDLTYKELLEHLDIDSAEAFWQTNMELSGDKVKDIYLLYHRLKKSKEDEKVKPLEIEDKQDPDYEQKVFKVSVKEFLAFTRRCKGTASYVDLLTMMHDNTRLEKFIRNEFKDLKERLPGEAKDAKK